MELRYLGNKSPEKIFVEIYPEEVNPPEIYPPEEKYSQKLALPPPSRKIPPKLKAFQIR